ncbi:Protein of Unknown Function (DUF239 [Striga hermonthica]|uniref:Neprosin PEP catalytic domain-containing protein n=1 Tax=Striga hermonthica TaxID=68872 RepID=A0A9N7NNB2_STRHE|nr:Protein of Unknown Function (DUF239 [Striga hermonthica]
MVSSLHYLTHLHNFQQVRYGDEYPKFFIYWTADAYQGTGCYNLECSGFVQTSQNIVPGAAIRQYSTYNGPQYNITLSVEKSPKDGHWWLKYNEDEVGYWPKEIFTNELKDHAKDVEFGGEIVDSRSSRAHTTTQMGSGHFPDEGYGKAAYIRNIEVLDENYEIAPATELEYVPPEKPNCYWAGSGSPSETWDTKSTPEESLSPKKPTPPLPTGLAKSGPTHRDTPKSQFSPKPKLHKAPRRRIIEPTNTTSNSVPTTNAPGSRARKGREHIRRRSISSRFGRKLRDAEAAPDPFLQHLTSPKTPRSNTTPQWTTKSNSGGTTPPNQSTGAAPNLCTEATGLQHRRTTIPSPNHRTGQARIWAKNSQFRIKADERGPSG